MATSLSIPKREDWKQVSVTVVMGSVTPQGNNGFVCVISIMMNMVNVHYEKKKTFLVLFWMMFIRYMLILILTFSL